MTVLILSLGTLALSPFLGASLRIIGADPSMAALLVIGSVATMAALTFSNAAIGLHRGSAQLWQGSLAAVLKLAVVGVLVLAGTRTAPGLLFAWALALVLSLVVCVPMLRLEPTPAGDGNLSHRLALARRYGTLSLKHHVLNVSINSVSYIIALIAALLIAPQELAYFTAAFLLSSTAVVIPYLLALSLFAETSGDPSLLHRHVRRTLPLGLALSGGIVVVAQVAAPIALRLFGPAYAMNGTTTLRLLVLVGPAYVIKDHYVAIRRAQGRERNTQVGANGVDDDLAVYRAVLSEPFECVRAAEPDRGLVANELRHRLGVKLGDAPLGRVRVAPNGCDLLMVLTAEGQPPRPGQPPPPRWPGTHMCLSAMRELHEDIISPR